MTNFKSLLQIFFISVAIISGTTNSHNIGSSHNATSTKKWNGTAEEAPSDIAMAKDKVQIEVYYETLCPFSVDFFVSQLKPAVERLGPHLDIRLIPYGNAKTRRVSGYYKFSCQHGIPECFMNTVQACAIDALRNTTRAVYFNTCLMQYGSLNIGYQYFRTVFNWCGYQEKVDVKEIWECVYSKHGTILLKRYGDETHALAPPYVPYLMINGSREYQDQATENLVDTVCQILSRKPRECSYL